MRKQELKKLSVIFFVGCFVFLTAISYALQYQIKTQLVSVTTTATKLPTTPLIGREYVLITNTDTSSTMFIGSSTVTSSGSTKGTPLLPSENYYAEYLSNIDIYGIVASGSVDAIVEEGK